MKSDAGFKQCSVRKKTFIPAVQHMLCNVLIHAIERQVETVENMEGKVQEQVKNGLCRRCNRKLKDPISVERGFGAICYHKYMAGLKIGKGLFEVKKNVIK